MTIDDTCRGPGSRWLTTRSTRRQFLGRAAMLGAGGAVVAVGAGLSRPATVDAAPNAARVLVEDLVQATAADFARGESRGVRVEADGSAALLRGRRGGVYTSAPLSTSFAATHLGLHWVVRGGAVDAVAAEARTSADGITWSDWRPATIEATAEVAGGQEVFAALVAADRGQVAQYRLTFQSDDVAVRQMTLTAIDAEAGSPRAPVATATEPPSVTLPVADGTSIPIVTRAGWGCDESLRFRRNREIWPEMYVPAKKVVVHHTATSNTYVDGAVEVRAIYTYHARTLGWGDIGYHLLVDRNGIVYEGRHGRGEGTNREIASADVVAGHVYAHNYGSTGIAVIGNSSAADWQATSSMLAALENAVTFECGRHFIDPQGASDFLRSDDVWHSGLEHCSGHSDSYATECPGTALHAYLPQLRATVSARLAGGPPPALAGSQTTADALSFTWSAPAGPYLFCLEGWYKPSRSENITYLSGYQDQSGPYGDPLAKAMLWSRTSDTAMAFTGLAPGHYTMHVRSETGTNADRYEANLTFLIAGSGGKKPRKP